jgi:hypothetical protein
MCTFGCNPYAFYIAYGQEDKDRTVDFLKAFRNESFHGKFSIFYIFVFSLIVNNNRIESPVGECALYRLNEAERRIEDMLLILLLINYQSNKDRIKDIAIVEKVDD